MIEKYFYANVEMLLQKRIEELGLTFDSDESTATKYYYGYPMVQYKSDQQITITYVCEFSNSLHEDIEETKNGEIINWERTNYRCNINGGIMDEYKEKFVNDRWVEA